MSLFKRFRAWRQRRQLKHFRQWLKDNRVCWDGARHDFRDYQDYFRRINNIQRTLR